MKHFFFCLCVAGFLSLFADESDPFDLEAAKEITLDQPENHFLTSNEIRFVSKVNPITGEYSEEEIDLVVAGSQPVSLRRFYNHTTPADPRYARWRYNPECFLVANLEGKGERFAAIGDFNGSVLSLTPSQTSFTFNPSKGFFASSSMCHPLTIKLEYTKNISRKDKHLFQFLGKVTDGTGRIRSFVSPIHRWNRNKHIHEKNKGGPFNLFGSDAKFRIDPAFWTPYHLPIEEERLPNGNVLRYEYFPWSDAFGVPHPVLLSAITAYNSEKTKVLGYIRLNYAKDKKGHVTAITATGSDGRKATFVHEVRKVQSKCEKWEEPEINDVVLRSVTTPQKPLQAYEYRWENRHDYFKAPFMFQSFSGEYCLATEYNFETKKVISQKAPVGPNGESCPVCRYEYQNNSTSVWDAEANKTVYCFDGDKKLIAIEVYQKNALYRKEWFGWDPVTGNLIAKKIEDPKGTLIKIEEYQYDKNQNPILERIGDGKEWRTLSRTFSEDGFNLKLTESDRPGKWIRYSYVPQTNLLASELVYEENKICSRKFHFYDDCAICIKSIIDDGSTEDPYNLQGVTYRKITEITPKQTIPCFGLPEIVEEKTINSAGQEILLHKVIYTYTPFGKILKEKHYDSNNEYRYTLVNTYDDRERLSSQTDALGHKKSFVYDANNNLIAISGPKSQQHQEIAYDKSNRPIRIADWQSDGAILITEKKYDKLGRLIEEIDPCGHKTEFQYDALSRLVATIHPDGAIERKEYDLLGNVIKEIDPVGYETHKTYNCFGQVLDIAYPDGSREHFTYHPTGTLASHQDKNGAIWRYFYDAFDHLIKREGLKITTANWTPFQKISETDGELTTSYAYDYAGRKIGEQKSYREIHYLLDALGRVETTQEGNTALIEEHDVLAQLIEKRKEKGGDLQFQESYAYDENGNCTQVIHSKGISETVFNTQNKPISVQDALGFTTQYSYAYADVLKQTTLNPRGIQTLVIHDPRGRESKWLKLNSDNQIIQQYENVYDKNGNRTALIHTIFSGTTPIKTITHKWEYGPLGRLERYLEAGLRETRYHYDDKGRLQTILKPNGKSLSHEYDDLGRLSRLFSSDFDYRYTYDLNDRVTSIYDKIFKTTTARSYDPLGNILEERLANGLILKNVYDKMGRRIRCILPDDSYIDYLYEGHYLYQITRSGYTHTYSKRNLEGEIVQASLPDSQELFIERDKLGRYATYRTPYYRATYPKEAYDGNGNLLCYHCQDSIGKAEYNFAYDDLDQLISEKDHTYRCDSLYNRLKKDDLDYTFDSFCQIDGYEYDASGNLISDGTYKYTYDALDRLTAVEDGHKRTEYTYDPFNRRLSKGSTRYLWDGDNEIGCLDDQIEELRILGEGLGAEIGAAILYELNGKSYMPIHDHRGCVVTLVDLQTKKPIESYRYDAFGEELTQNTLSPWRFASKRADEETDLIFFGRRYYNPSLGRFITQDPEGFKDGPNLYAYLKNCPLADFDPYGLWSWGDTWGGTRNFVYGTGSQLWSGVDGLRSGVRGAGEWLHAGYQYARYNDFSFLQEKAYRSRDEWKSLGKTFLNNPFDVLTPGLMEAWRNPTSAEAWGRFTADVALLGFIATKGAGSLANVGRTARIGEEVSTFGKAGKTVDLFSTKRISPLSSGSEKFFEGTKYSSKVLHQMNKANDIYHAFPMTVDRYASKFGTWSTKVGSDGKAYHWLELPGSYRGQTGVFEFIKDQNGIINHRHFRVN